VKKVRVFPKLAPHPKKHNASQPDYFVFCEKNTGIAQFRAAAHADLECTIERTAALLAMQCLVRGYEPGNFAILVPAEKTLANRLASRAKELLEEGREVAAPASLSPRQREILHSVICNRANKEIAAKLNITVRTVKFHISSLLAKFGVENREELARRAVGFLRPATLEGGTPGFEDAPEASRRRELQPVTFSTTLHITDKARSMRFPGRILTA
jgi:DNA-binding CsgD family transcriptional regulator